MFSIDDAFDKWYKNFVEKYPELSKLQSKDVLRQAFMDGALFGLEDAHKVIKGQYVQA